jgi:hypothetical protein
VRSPNARSEAFVAQFFDRSPTTRDLQRTKHLNDQTLQSHRGMKGKMADEQRRRLKAALKEGREKAKKALEKLQQLAKDAPKHKAEKDEQSMHGAHELDEYMHALQKHAHETHAEVDKFEKSHGATFEQGHEGHHAEVFQIVVAFIVLMQHVGPVLGPLRKQLAELKKLAAELRSALSRIKAAAKG